MPKKYKVTTAGIVNVRDRGGATLGNKIGEMKPGQVGYGYETMGSADGQYYCLHVTDGIGLDGWVYQRYNWTNTYATIEVVEDVVEPPIDPPLVEKTFAVSVVDNQTGEVYTGTLVKRA